MIVIYLPLTFTHTFLLPWKHQSMLIIIMNFSGQPSFYNIFHKATLLTVSNAFDKSTRTWYKYILCSTHFSCNCLTEKIISVVLRPAHRHSWSTSLAICWSIRFNIIQHCGKLSEIFEVKNRVKHEDILPYLLFAMVFYITFKNCDDCVYIHHLILGEC